MNDAAAHRQRALDALIFVLDATLMLSNPKLAAHRIEALKAKRDKAAEEFVDESALATQLAILENAT